MPARTTQVVAVLAVLAVGLAMAAGIAAAGPASPRMPSVADHARAAKVLRHVDPSRTVSVSVTLRHDHRGVLRRLHRGDTGRISRAQVIRRHGATDADIRAVRRWAAAHGLRSRVGRLRTRVIITGPAARMAAAFGVRLRHHRARTGRTYVAATPPVQVPRQIAGPATGVAGLSHAPPPVRPTGSGTSQGATAPAPQAGGSPVLGGCATGVAMDMTPQGWGFPVTPLGIAQAYGFDGIGNGASYPTQSMAILELGQNYNPSDVAQYQADCRFSPGTTMVTQVNMPGAQTLVGTRENGEAQLDAQWAAALAPAGARVAVINVDYRSPSWMADFMEQAMALPNLTVASISYDASEVESQGAATTPPEEYVQFQHGVQMVAAMGITVVVASGDQGSMGPPLTACSASYPSYGLPGQASVNWLGASPGSTAVGGTMWPGFIRPASETVWSQPAGFGPTPFACGAAGGGGGQSVVSARPPWQAMAGAGIAGTKRLVPDLSLLAGAPGFATIMNGASSITQGTSAGAPILGAAVMRINAERLAAGRKPVGFLNPLLYGPLAPTFRDITQGDNDVFGNGICCTAGPGFDMASGLGSPDIGKWPALIP